MVKRIISPPSTDIYRYLRIDNPQAGDGRFFFFHQNNSTIKFTPCSLTGSATGEATLSFKYIQWVQYYNPFIEFNQAETVLSGQFNGCWMTRCERNRCHFAFHIHNSGEVNCPSVAAWNNHIAHHEYAFGKSGFERFSGKNPRSKNLRKEITQQAAGTANSECFGAIEYNDFFSLYFEKRSKNGKGYDHNLDNNIFILRIKAKHLRGGGGSISVCGKIPFGEAPDPEYEYIEMNNPFAGVFAH